MNVMIRIRMAIIRVNKKLIIITLMTTFILMKY
jgi:hypothetical protein